MYLFLFLENHAFLFVVKANAKKMSVHLNVAFCSDIAVLGILLCAGLGGVPAF